MNRHSNKKYLKGRDFNMISQFVKSICFVLCISAFSSAQETVLTKAGLVQFMKGEVFLDGKPVSLPGSGSLQLENSQILSTRNGYVEMLLAREASLRLGENASLLMRKTELSGTQLELNLGSAMVEILSMSETNPIKIFVSRTELTIKEAGLYRVDAAPGKCSAYAGNILVREGTRNIRVKSGRIIYLDSQLAIEKLDSKAVDSLHQWAARRSFENFTSQKLMISSLDPSNDLNWILKPNGQLKSSAYRLSFPADPDWIKKRQEVADKFSIKK
jgi:hypothetical protein